MSGTYRIDSDAQLAIDTLVQIGLLDLEGLKRFAGLVRSLQGLSSAVAPRGNGVPKVASSPPAEVAAPASPIQHRRGRKRGKLEITKDALRAAYATKSSAQIAAEHDVTSSAVQQRLAKWKIKKPAAGSVSRTAPGAAKAAAPKARRGRRRGGIELSAEVLRQAYAVKTTAQIGREHGLSPGAVQMRLKRLGISKPGGRSGVPRAKTRTAVSRKSRRARITREELQQAYASKSAGQIAKDYGVSRKSIERRLSKWGIKKPGGAKPNAARAGASA